MEHTYWSNTFNKIIIKLLQAFLTIYIWIVNDYWRSQSVLDLITLIAYLRMNLSDSFHFNIITKNSKVIWLIETIFISIYLYVDQFLGKMPCRGLSLSFSLPVSFDELIVALNFFFSLLLTGTWCSFRSIFPINIKIKPFVYVGRGRFLKIYLLIFTFHMNWRNGKHSNYK